jgi:glucose-6-phosphate dehydrogenase assembly protein OpcA
MKRLNSFKDLEKELFKLYESEGEACRASLFNVVVYSPTPKREAYIKEFVGKIVDRFPCRLIFINEIPEPGVTLTVDIDVKSHASVSCDYIEIKIGMDEAFKLPYLVLPHLLPDLPLYLLWGDNPLQENELYKTLSPHASRIIYDTIHVKNLTQFAARFLQHPDKKLRDVNWTLISDWREVICRVIDSDEKKAALKEADRVKIIYQQESSVQSRFLKGWMVQYLGVNPDIFTLMQQECHEAEGDIFGIEVTTPKGEFFAFYKRGGQATVHLASKETCDLPLTYPLNAMKRGFTFWRELLFEKSSIEYLKVLEFIRDE